jgi:NarL family two-component system response regulator LiaR
MEGAGQVDIGKPVRVVVVDDSAADLDALCSFLRTQSRIEIVGTAKNGIELLKIVEELRPDLVITDLHLPRMNGIECTLRLRETMPETRFIVFTDLDSPFTETDCAVPGADFYLYKEHMPERVMTAIHRLFPDLAQPEARRDVDCSEGVAC